MHALNFDWTLHGGLRRAGVRGAGAGAGQHLDPRARPPHHRPPLPKVTPSPAPRRPLRPISARIRFSAPHVLRPCTPTRQAPGDGRHACLAHTGADGNERITALRRVWAWVRPWDGVLTWRGQVQDAVAVAALLRRALPGVHLQGEEREVHSAARRTPSRRPAS
jgi:hypothetical protein